MCTPEKKQVFLSKVVLVVSLLAFLHLMHIRNKVFTPPPPLLDNPTEPQQGVVEQLAQRGVPEHEDVQSQLVVDYAGNSKFADKFMTKPFPVGDQEMRHPHHHGCILTRHTKFSYLMTLASAIVGIIAGFSGSFRPARSLVFWTAISGGAHVCAVVLNIQLECDQMSALCSPKPALMALFGVCLMHSVIILFAVKYLRLTYLVQPQVDVVVGFAVPPQEDEVVGLAVAPEGGAVEMESQPSAAKCSA